MYYVVYAILKPLSCLPFGVLYVLSDILYELLYHVVRYRRQIVRRNLVESFPEKSAKEIKQIEKRFYHSFVDIALESVKLLSMSEREMRRRMVFKGMDEVNKLLDEGHDIAVYIGHYGNWEWISSIGLWITADCECAQIYHKLRNKAMDRLMLKLRSRMGNNVGVEMRSTARYMTAATRDSKPRIIGFIADQSPKKREVRDFLTFLHHRVPVLTGTERLVKHYGYKAMFFSTRRVKRGYYECEVSMLHDDTRSLPDYRLTEMYFARLQRDIEQAPELYLWSHNRFKHAEFLSFLNTD